MKESSYSKDSFYWFFNPSSISNFFKTLEMMYFSPKTILKSAFFITENDPIKVFKSITEYLDKIETNIIPLNKGKDIYRLEFKISTKEKKLISKGIFLKYPNYQNLYFYVSLDTTYLFKKTIKNFFNKGYPEISRVFLTSNQIRNVFSSLENTYKSEINTTRFVVNRKYPDTKSEVRYIKKPIPYKKAFFDAEKENLWVSSLKFLVSGIGDLEGYISREGFLKLEKGSFKVFYGQILEKIASISNAKKLFYSNRERTKQKFKASPIVIKYDEDVFKTEDSVKGFVDSVFNELPYSFYTIFHLNPYLHMSFTDMKDGSTYDIWVTSPEKVMIVPQLRATFSSFLVLVNRIFERFREGDVIDYETGKQELECLNV